MTSKKIRTFCLKICILSIFFEGCVGTNTSVNSYYQSAEKRDSLYVIHTIKQWDSIGWKLFDDGTRNYFIKREQIEYFLTGFFFNNEKTKMVVWFGKKMPNANARKVYNIKADVMCPGAGDSIVEMNAIIGYRETNNSLWQLFPFDNETIICYPDRKAATNIMESYYFHTMKGHQMWYISQSGENKGKRILKAYEYNLQDKNFWVKCWLWERDTIGSDGLYPFEEDYYYNGHSCIKCAKKLQTPEINYPEEILSMYSE